MEKVFIIDYTGVNANIAQIQVLASIIKDMVNNKFSIESKDLLYNIPLPLMYKTWESLYEFCQKYSNAIIFVIKSEILGLSKYICDKYDYNLPDSIIYLRLFALQNQFDKLNNIDLIKMKGSEVIELTDSLINTYMLLNNDIGNYFLNVFCDCKDFDYQLKLKPCCVDLSWVRDLWGFGRLIIYEFKKIDRKNFEMIFQVRMQEMACQCRFLSFWACLLQIISCTSLPKRVLDSFRSFALCLLKNVDSAFIHYIIVEQSPLNNNNVLNRGSNDNTTRIKVYFTYEDGEPLMVRFDLPHKGVPYLHINIEDANGKTPSFNHCKLSISPFKENILKPLEESLMTFNYSGINFSHSTPDIDHSILHKVKLERALFGLSPIIWSTIIFTQIYNDDNKGIYNWDEKHQKDISKQSYDYINECRNVLKHEIALYGISESLSDFDVFDLIYNEINYDKKNIN